MKEIIIVTSIILSIILTTSYWINENDKLEYNFQIECLKQGGEIKFSQGKYSEMYCTLIS